MYIQKAVYSLRFATLLLLPFVSFAANKPPKVDAGPGKRVVYPSSTTTTLVGSGSDAEGPVTFKWAQISGVSASTILQPTGSTTGISNLVPGIYTYTLTVTDNKGVSRRDTTTVSVLQKVPWNVSGSSREALVHPSSVASGTHAVVFAFHGHGGTDSGYAEKGFELSWPEAIVVYPQGLRTMGNEDLNCKQPGWQRSVGEVNCRTNVTDQDLKFFDAMLPTLQQMFGADLSHVYAHGWSNGGEFVYNALWPGRGNKLAGIGPIGAVLDSVIGTNGKIPMSLIHTAGTNDVRAIFSTQQETAEKVRVLNQCAPTGTPWASGPSGLLGTYYSSPINKPVVFLQYNGTHMYPFTIPPLIMRFFRELTPQLQEAPLISQSRTQNTTADKGK